MLKRTGVCFLLVAVFIFAAKTWADPDSKGSFAPVVLNDVFIQPTLRAIEGGGGGMDSLQWSLGAKTSFASWVDIQGSVGASQLLYLPSWSQPQIAPGAVALIDFIGTLHSIIGDIYAGQTLVPWGLDGQTKEALLWLPRDLFYEKGAFPLRDVGVGIKTEVNGFYMNLMAHNGEGGDLGNQDNRMFLTSQWGYMGPANTNFGLSLTAGRVAAPLVINEEHLRGGNIFFGFNIFGLGLQAEGSYLQAISNPQTVDTFAWHADVEHPITDRINFIGRYEQFNPNTRVTSNILGRIYAGGEYHSKNNSSRLFLFGVQNSESLAEVPNNEIRLMWRITPPQE